jgi:hypothetical protein
MGELEVECELAGQLKCNLRLNKLLSKIGNFLWLGIYFPCLKRIHTIYKSQTRWCNY